MRPRKWGMTGINHSDNKNLKNLEDITLLRLIEIYADLYYDILCHEEQLIVLTDRKYNMLLENSNRIQKEILKRCKNHKNKKNGK